MERADVDTSTRDDQPDQGQEQHEQLELDVVDAEQHRRCLSSGVLRFFFFKVKHELFCSPAKIEEVPGSTEMQFVIRRTCPN